MIHLKDINKTYNNGQPLHVLKGINLDIEQGEFVSIMGASGSGKSTLLNILGILDNYDSGEYTLAGTLIKDLSETRAAEYRNRMIGFIFQSFNLIAFKTAVENVELPLFYQGVGRRQRHRMAMEYLERLGLEQWANHYPNEMSGGQKQRVAIARMLMQRAPIMVFDDSLSAVDAETDAKIRAALHESLGKATVLLISHRVTTLMQADCILVLDGGRVSELGTHAELIAKPGIYRDIYDIQMSSDDRRLLGKEGV